METKMELKFFTIFEYEKEQEYLRRMNNAGWKLSKVSGLGVYRFEKCECEDVIYQLDYNREGIEHKAEYVKMFNDCGWEYLQDYMGYSYFRKPAAQADGAEEIFCDDASRLQMMERVFKGRMIPLLIIFLCVLLPGLIRALCSQSYVIAALYSALIALYIAIFAASAHYYFKLKGK